MLRVSNGMLRLILFFFHNLTGFYLAERAKFAAMVQSLSVIIVVVVPMETMNAITIRSPNGVVLTRPPEHGSVWRETFGTK